MKELFQNSIIRVIFFLLICKDLYTETGIMTVILFAIILFENSFNADHFNAISKLNTTISDKVRELIDFQNEYIIPRLKNGKGSKDGRKSEDDEIPKG